MKLCCEPLLKWVSVPKDKNMITNIKDQIMQALKDGDKPEDLICFYRERESRYDNTFKTTFSDIDNNTPAVQCSFNELPDREYNKSYGGTEGPEFIAFSERFIYVNVCYDGSEWVEAVPRHPIQVNISEELPWLGGG